MTLDPRRSEDRPGRRTRAHPSLARQPYADLEAIDFSRMYSVLRDLVFLDDTFLSMQAINVSIVDKMITHGEYDLLRECREIERTPTDSVMEVSALSQMWIFELYELLRTWRERIYDFRKQYQNGMLEARAKRLLADAEAEQNIAALIRAAQARRVIEAPSVLEGAEFQLATVKPVYKMIDLLRVNLAKHQAPGRSNVIPVAPGYGRINSQCGALDFQVTAQDRTFVVLNRRDVADALRAVEVVPANEK